MFGFNLDDLEVTRTMADSGSSLESETKVFEKFDSNKKEKCFSFLTYLIPMKIVFVFAKISLCY